MSVIANRYIQALLELPKSKEENEMLEKGLQEIAELLSSNEELNKVLLDPRINSEQKMDIVKELIPDFATNKMFMNFINLLIKEKRINYIQEIAEEYRKTNLATAKELEIKIIVADKIDESQVKAIEEKYKTMYQVETIKSEIEVDESILGGVKIVVGNKVYDGSVARQLNEMF